jgi:uncharacterized protein YjbJ (UPF0337 family)
MGILALAGVAASDKGPFVASDSERHSRTRTRVEAKPMKASTRNRAEGKLREVEGALKEAIGAAARDRDVEVEGKRKKRAGRVQGGVGRVQRAVGR